MGALTMRVGSLQSYRSVFSQLLVNYLLSWLHTQALILRIDCCQESNVTVTYLATEIDNLC